MAKLAVVIGVKETGSKPLIAAEALKKAAGAAGTSLSIETQTPTGVTAPLDAATIAAADAVLIVGDVADEARFAGKTVRRLTLAAQIDDAQIGHILRKQRQQRWHGVQNADPLLYQRTWQGLRVTGDLARRQP